MDIVRYIVVDYRANKWIPTTNDVISYSIYFNRATGQHGGEQAVIVGRFGLFLFLAGIHDPISTLQIILKLNIYSAIER